MASPPKHTPARSRPCSWNVLYPLCILFLFLLYISWPLAPENLSCFPIEIHLGLTEDPSTMRITWRTQGNSCPSFVHYASLDDSNDNEQRVAYGFYYVGDSNNLCGYAASSFNFKLNLHTVVLEDLVPNGRYEYYLPSDERTFSFQASKPAGDALDSVFYIFGDMGVTMEDNPGYEGAEIVQKAMWHEFEQQQPELILQIGDISYANGNPNIWDAFMSAIEPFTQRTVWISTIGNHEYGMRDDGQLDPWGLEPYFPKWGTHSNGDSDGECGLHTYWRFPAEQNFFPFPSASGYLIAPPFGSPFPPFYFSFDHGVVHFVMLSTEHDVEPGSPQLTWLENDLASVDRCKTPFVVATGHRPFYAPISDPKDYETGRGLKNYLEDTLIRNGVDIFVSGHIHTYYHLCESRNGTCVSEGEGLKSMVIGTAGRVLEEVKMDDFGLEVQKIVPSHGFSKVTVKGKESMEFEFIEADSGEVQDIVRFVNRHSCT